MENLDSENIRDEIVASLKAEGEGAAVEDSTDEVSGETQEEVLEESAEVDVPADDKKEEVKEDAAKEDSEKDESAKDEPTEEDEFADLKGQTTIPYKRFNKVLTQRNEYKEVASKKDAEIAELREKTSGLEEARGVQKQLESQGITEEALNQGVAVLVAEKSNPQEAYKYYQRKLEELSVLTGNKIPAEIQQDVDLGVISEARAKELAQAKADAKIAGDRVDSLARQQEAQSHSAWESELKQKVTKFEAEKQASDPDYKANSKLVADLFRGRLPGLPQSATPAETMKLMEDCYADVLKLNGGAKQKADIKPPVSQGAGNVQNKVPELPERFTAEDLHSQMVAELRNGQV